MIELATEQLIENIRVILQNLAGDEKMYGHRGYMSHVVQALLTGEGDLCVK